MWCKNCHRETIKEKCELCGAETEQEIPLEIYWCDDCKVPIVKYVNSVDRDICPMCGGSTAYLCADLRPVFPEERLMFEIIQDKPLAYIGKSVWASDNRYYIDGKPTAITSTFYKKLSPDIIKQQLVKYKPENNYTVFNTMIARFVKTNETRLCEISDEAHSFIQQTASTYQNENVVISFSGGKDSTVTADLTVRALSDPSLVHIFGNTTLEFPMTLDYAARFRQDNPKAIFKPL
jgi:phosphoadenosine phosphosulfate reductase